MWRPNDWKKVYQGKWRDIRMLNEAFEMGADAMLVALRKRGAADRQRGEDGRVVFIPGDKE